MSEQEIPELYLYRRIVQAKLFINAYSAESIQDGSGNWFSLSEKPR